MDRYAGNGHTRNSVGLAPGTWAWWGKLPEISGGRAFWADDAIDP